MNPVTSTQPPPLPPARKPFAFQAAQASLLASLLAIGVSIVVNGGFGSLSSLAKLIGGLFCILLILLGFVFGILALCLPRNGATGILWRAIAGLCVNAILIGLMLISIPVQMKMAERNQEIRERQMQHQQKEQESQASDFNAPPQIKEIDRQTFSLSLPEHWTENAKDDMYQPDSFVFFEGPGSCFFNVVIGKKSTGLSIDTLIGHQTKEAQRRFTEMTLTEITRWAGFDGKGVEIEGKPGGLIRSRIRIFGFENSENVCLISEFGDIPDLEKHANDFDHIHQTFQLKSSPGENFSAVASQLYKQGFGKLATGDTTNAIRDFSKALVLKPDFAEAYNKRGVAERRFDASAALADFDRAIELEPRFTEAYFNRGVTKQEKGDVKSAITDYDKALELNPALISAHSNRGMAKVALHDWAGAMEDFDKAIELNPKATRIYVSRAHLKEAQGDTDGAFIDYNKAIEIQPDYSSAYEDRGSLKKLKGDTTGAQADYKKAAALNALKSRATK
jgi:tetratricopeptide (TPR) repeat protein